MKLSVIHVRSLVRLYRANIRSTLQLSYPIVIAQIGIVMMGVTDSLMVGGLGASPLAASGIANSIFFFVVVVGIGTLALISPLVAAAKSQKDYIRCSLLLSNGLLIALLITLMTIQILTLANNHFYIFQQKEEVAQLAIDYLYIIAYSSFPMFIFIASKNFTDGLSITKPAMYVTFICFFLNIFFNWILIYGNLGMPALGLNGAGIATFCSRLLMAIGMLLIIFSSTKIRSYIPNFHIFRFDLPVFVKILRLGIPAGAQYLFEGGAFTGAAIMIGWLGRDQLAAHQIAISLASITYMIALGFSSAGSIKVGDALGKVSRPLIIRYGTSALLLSVGVMTFSCIIFITLNNFLVSLYIDTPAVTTYAVSLLIIAGFFQLSDGIQCTMLGVLRGLEDVNIPTYITLFAYWIVGIPLGYYLGFHTYLNVQGIWIGLSVGLTVSAVLLTLRFYLLAFRRDFRPTAPEEATDILEVR